MGRVLTLAAFGVLGLMATACGQPQPDAVDTDAVASSTMTAESSSPPAISVAEPLLWQRDVLGESPPDSGVGAATNGYVTVVVAGAEDGAIRAWWSDGGDFAPADVTSDDHQGSPIGNVTVTSHEDGFRAIVTDWESFEPRVWTSDDGRRWELSLADGLKGPADVYTFLSTPDGLLVAGSLRITDESSGVDFVPVLWRSSDGLNWEQLPGPAGSKPREGGHVSDLVVTEDSIIAVGRKSSRVAVWRSTDGGETWERSTIKGGESIGYRSVRSVARLDDALFGVGMVGNDLVGDPVVLTSTDDGRTWTISPFENPVAPGLEGSVGTIAAAGGLWGSTSRYVDSWTDPDACYRDLSTCQGGAGQVLLYSGDATDWAEVDLESFGLPPDLWLEDILDISDGVLLLGGLDGKIATWRSSDVVPPPTLPPATEPPTLDVPLAEPDTDLKLGATYRYPLYIHCGMDFLGSFNDHFWYLDSTPEARPETGSGDSTPDSWPVAQQTIFGYITRVDSEKIEYSINDGELVAVYSRSQQPYLGCE